MRRTLAAAVVVAMAASPAATFAQTASGPAPAVDAAALGVSLSRIQRRLVAESQARSEGVSPLKLDFFVDVYGVAPRLVFFDPRELLYGPVPGSAPTHGDMIRHNLPQAFRSPRVDFLGIVTGVAMYGAKKVQRWDYERDLAAYRKRVEAGENVPAPKPPK
ncbi:MAG: hypothetical protein R2708_14790 [Vicinamibacterales bacterium]|jgi:hypothetical protein